MHDWLRTVTVGQQDDGFVPMAVFKAVGPLTIRFALASGQGGARTLEIGTTLAFAGARPQVQLNAFSSAIPAVPTQPDSRGVTRGTWRGNVSGCTFVLCASRGTDCWRDRTFAIHSPSVGFELCAGAPLLTWSASERNAVDGLDGQHAHHQCRLGVLRRRVPVSTCVCDRLLAVSLIGSRSPNFVLDAIRLF